MFAVSNDESKQVLTGVNVQATADGLKFAATDGHRLAVVSIPDTKYDTNIEVTIPGKAFKELVNLSAGNDVQFSFDQGQAAFKAEGWELFSRTLDGSYPDYPQLIPKMFGRIITLNRAEAIEVFARIDSVVDGKTPVIKLAIETDTIVFHAEQAQVNSGTEAIDCSLEGEPTLMGFNARYLAEAIKFTSSEAIYIKANTPTSPVIIQGADNDDCLALVMPLQIRT
jgi:DNA polymerase-3 subunit beta